MKEKSVLIPWKYFGKKINISDFTHIRAYHACRIEDIGEYQINGLQPVNETTALANALRILGRFEKSKQRIESKFRERWTVANEDPLRFKVWLELKKSELLGDSCHYLIYGSEFLNNIALDLGCRHMLKTVGHAYILTCEIPLKNILPSWLEDLCYHIENGCERGCGFPVERVLPEEIIKFENQNRVVEDPLDGYSKVKLG